MTSLEAKIVLLGAQSVGKTSLVHRYVHGTPPPSTPTPSTIGASFLTKRVPCPDTDPPTTLRLQIWDTAGQERFRSISRLYYRGANACILCYSIVDERSFQEMGRWLSELRRELGEEVILHVVGTKADLVTKDPSTRAVPFERCIAYVAEYLYPNQTSTPPQTATPGGSNSLPSESTAAYRAFLAGLGAGEPVKSPYTNHNSTTAVPYPMSSENSKRSSGFWGQDVGWDCCHEISAESGEGVEEVFRVVTRKLVEQDRARARGVNFDSATTADERREDGGGGTRSASYLEGMNARGSFRVGRDRRSWLGIPGMVATPGAPVEVAGGEELDSERIRRKGKCC